MPGAEERLWIMVDVETSGPVYGTHSLVELGAVVGSRQRGVMAEFSTLITPIGEAVERSRRTYYAAKERGVAPREAMTRFAEWARPHLAARAQFVARPAAFDWPWIVYYAWTYLGENPLGFKAVCASSWFEALGRRFHVELPHVAVEDARVQLIHFLEAL
jgi:DNA polymerase III epsilon subunit-like protein